MADVELSGQFETSNLLGLIFQIGISDALLLKVLFHVDWLKVLHENFTELVFSKCVYSSHILHKRKFVTFTFDHL